LFNSAKKILQIRNSLRNSVGNLRSSKLFYNFVSLFFLQVTNFILPLLVVPYLVQSLGIEKFGMVSFAQTLMSFFVIITDYGFNLSATREIALYKADIKKIASIYNNVFTTRIFLCLCSFLILLILIAAVPRFRENGLLFIMSFGITIGYVLQPIWFFQGMEDMKYITYLNLLAKILFTVLIFIFIKSPADYILANIFLGLGGIVSGLMSLLLVYKKFNITLQITSLENIWLQLREGWPIFASSFSVNIYINSNILILGLFANSTIVGYYSIAEKVTFAVRQILGVFSQVIYPYICSLTLNSHAKIQTFFKTIYVPFAGLILLLCTMIYFFSKEIVVFLAGQDISEIIYLMKMLSFVPFIVLLNIPAYQTLLAYNQKSSYSLILTIGSLTNFILNVWLASSISATGTALAVIITESFITIGLYVILELKHSQYSLFINSSKTI
jgi:polysaccharide transporter, PST family